MNKRLTLLLSADDGNWDGGYSDGCDNALHSIYDGSLNVTGLADTAA
jgi:hypothetical protein